MDEYVEQLSPDEQPIDGIWLVQEYVDSAEPFITRCEFIGQEFFYAVRVNTSDGFELCPADACEIGENTCPTTEAPNKFSILPGLEAPELLRGYQALMKSHGIDVAGFEFIRKTEGDLYTYDINTNTNYNAQAEKKARLEQTAMQRLASFLGRELDLTRSSARENVATIDSPSTYILNGHTPGVEAIPTSQTPKAKNAPPL